MKDFIKITFNNYSTGKGELKPGWGFSAWISLYNKNILFDTGSDGSLLLHNLNELNLNPRNLDLIFISHTHNDHIAGLSSLRSLIKPGIPVYIPEATESQMNEQFPGLSFNEVNEAAELIKDVWSSGSIYGNYKGIKIPEQSIILNKNNNLRIITGCSHPGVENIIERVKKVFPDKVIQLITGGFHIMVQDPDQCILRSSNLKKAGVKEIAPSHCISAVGTGTFRKEWKENFRKLYLGDEYEII